MIKSKLEKVIKFGEACTSLGKVGLLIVEGKGKKPKTVSDAMDIFVDAGFSKCDDYVAILDHLPTEKCLYVESGEKIDGSVVEIIAEYESGIVSLADRKGKSGLKTSRFNPVATSLIVIVSREQLEKSYSKIFDHVTLTQTI